MSPENKTQPQSNAEMLLSIPSTSLRRVLDPRDIETHFLRALEHQYGTVEVDILEGTKQEQVKNALDAIHQYVGQIRKKIIWAVYDHNRDIIKLLARESEMERPGIRSMRVEEPEPVHPKICSTSKQGPTTPPVKVVNRILLEKKKAVIDFLKQTAFTKSEGSSNREIPDTANLDVLTLDNMDEFYDLYLDGLQGDPENFGSDYDTQIALTTRQKEDYIESNFIVGAYIPSFQGGVRGRRLIGFIVVKPYEGPGHVYLDWGPMYVEKAHRNNKIGELLMETAMSFSEHCKYEEVNCIVTASNGFAVEWYKRFGFEPGQIQYKRKKFRTPHGKEQEVDWLPMKMRPEKRRECSLIDGARTAKRDKDNALQQMRKY